MRGYATRSPDLIDDDNGYRSMGSIFADAVSADYGVAVANVASNDESGAFSPFRFENSVRPKIQASGSVIADLGMFMCRPASSSPDLFGVASATVIAWRDGDHTTLMAYGVAVPNKAVGLHRIGISSADRGNSGCLSLGPHNGGKATPTRSHLTSMFSVGSSEKIGPSEVQICCATHVGKAIPRDTHSLFSTVKVWDGSGSGIRTSWGLKFMPLYQSGI